jgi:hypothetical protein
MVLVGEITGGFGMITKINTNERTEFYGKSADEKPIYGTKNADLFYEMDSGKVFMFDADTMTWVEQK